MTALGENTDGHSEMQMHWAVLQAGLLCAQQRTPCCRLVGGEPRTEKKLWSPGKDCKKKLRYTETLAPQAGRIQAEKWF